MNNRRALGLVLRVGAAWLWGGAMGVAGLWALLSAPREWPAFAGLWRAGGLAALGAGLFVFMVLAADRLFPRADRGLVAGAELGAMGVFLAGLVLAVVSAADGGLR